MKISTVETMLNHKMMSKPYLKENNITGVPQIATARTYGMEKERKFTIVVLTADVLI